MTFEQYQKQINKLQANIRQELFESLAKEMGGRLLSLVIPRTPTWRPNEDQKRGYIETPAGQHVHFTTKDGKTVDFITKQPMRKKIEKPNHRGGTLRRGWTAKPVERTGNRYRVTVINPVEYASYVEFGHRQKPGRYVPQIGKRLKRGWVPGQYMLTTSEKDLQEWAKTHMAKRFDAYLQKALKG